MVIDVHTHIFNLKYIPVGSVIHQFPNKKLIVPKWIAKGIANIFLSFTKETEIPKHEEFMALSEEEIASEVAEAAPNEIVNEPEAKAAIIELIGDEPIAMLDDQKALFEVKSETVREYLENYGQNKAFIDTSPIDKKIIENAILRFFDKYFNTPLQLLRWVYLQTWEEKKIIEKMHKLYGSVDFFVHHDMDMKNWYTSVDEPTFDYSEQQERISYFINRSDNKLKAFVAFDPKRPDWKKIIDNAIDRLGYTGVKFYPPSGYKPIGNNEQPLVEERILELYAHCIDRELPLFTHCNKTGMMACEDCGEKSDPKYWMEVMAQFPKLKLCLGHAGGGEGWIAKKDADYEKSHAKIVYDLCTIYDNVYCEFGYLDELLDFDRENLPHFINRLKTLIRQEPEFANKIMYGSDYHMLYQEIRHEEFLARFETVFTDDELAPYKKKFFSENAMKYLNMVVA